MKKFFYFIVFFFGITFSCFLGYSKEHTVADIERIERHVIEYREQITSWHVRLLLTDEFRDSESGAKLDPMSDMIFAGNMECYKEGELLHEERGYFVNDTKEKYLLKTIFNKKWRYMFGNDKVRHEGSDVDIPILHMMASSKIVGGPYTTPYDIRSLGITPSVDIRFDSDTLTAYIGNPQRNNLMMSDDIIGDKKCCKISFSLLKHPEENMMSIWICPELGYNPLKFEIDFPNLKTINYYKGRQRGTFDIEVSNNNNKKIWFPKKISCRAMHGEHLDKLISSRNLAIEVVSFNKSLDPKLFDERGLDLPVGTLVLMDPEPPVPDTYTWDGEKIVGLSGATLEQVILPARSNAFRYFLIAAGFALISIACLFKYFELRKK
jgi:hypothetical protein